MKQRCPPHKFKAAWQDESRGVVYCQWCGDIMPLQAPSIEAPDEERITERIEEAK